MGFVSNKPIVSSGGGGGRKPRIAPECIMKMFKPKSLLPQTVINKAEHQLHIGYHPSWMKDNILTIVMTCVCCGAEGTVHTFGKHNCPKFTSTKQRPRNTSHLKLARIAVNTLDNVPAQDGDDEDLVNLTDVEDNAY